MATTLTAGATVITPRLVDGYEAESEAGNVVAYDIDNAAVVTLRPDGPRTGVLVLLFDDKDEAWDARNALAEPAVWLLEDDQHPGIEMSFVRRGRMRITLDPKTRRAWLLEVDFLEVVSP